MRKRPHEKVVRTPIRLLRPRPVVDSRAPATNHNAATVMTEKVRRTSISIPPEVETSAKKRMKSLKYRKFSQYVVSLIEQDLARGGGHTIIRKET